MTCLPAPRNGLVEAVSRARHGGLDPPSPDKVGDSCFRGNDRTIAGDSRLRGGQAGNNPESREPDRFRLCLRDDGIVAGDSRFRDGQVSACFASSWCSPREKQTHIVLTASWFFAVLRGSSWFFVSSS
ncbi:MAG: hypothetical protein LBR51_00450 [Bacteroidales bacterium]|nr:hypothetical protein [Bacteroidales bacterium]